MPEDQDEKPPVIPEKFRLIEKNKDAPWKFVQNRNCPFFPCHKNVKISEFNCLFCFCPLYALGDKCGGNVQYTADGKKDCSQCSFPHHKAAYDTVVKRLGDLVEITKIDPKNIPKNDFPKK